MNRSLQSLILSLCVHLCLVLLYFALLSLPETKEPQQRKITLGNLNVKEMQEILPQESHANLAQKTLPQTAQIPTQPKQTEPTIQNKALDSKQAQQNKPNKVSKDSKTKATEPKQASSTKQPKQSPQSHTPPSFYSLMEQGYPKLDEELKKAYGEDFYVLSKEDKQFLDENYRRIYQVTQRNLRYPLEAGRLRLEGVNKVEFYLEPNGDIRNLKITSPSGYAMFDKNSLHTIEISHKDYPRPKKPLKIVFYIHYKIMR